MKKHKKHLDFELNLIPFIDLLSTCICFLLITAVWMNVGSLSAKQAVGGQSQAETQKTPMLWVFMEKDGSVSLDLKDALAAPQSLKKAKIQGKSGALDLDSIQSFAQQIVTNEPGLRKALIQPQAQSSYEDIIQLMDSFKRVGLGDLGVVPL